MPSETSRPSACRRRVCSRRGPPASWRRRSSRTGEETGSRPGTTDAVPATSSSARGASVASTSTSSRGRSRRGASRSRLATSSPRRSSLAPAGGPAGSPADRPRSGARPAPVEREVLARPPVPFPLPAEAVDAVRRRDAPGRNLARSHLRAGWVVCLHPLAGKRRRTAQRFRAPPGPAGHLDGPVGEVVGDLEGDRRVLDPAHLADRLGEFSRPAAGLTPEDRLQRPTLRLVGALVDVDAHRRLRLARPEVAHEGAERDHVQIVEPDVAVVPLADVPGEDALAVALARRLRERAGAGNGALADVESVALEMPARDVGHAASFARIGRILLLVAGPVNRDRHRATISTEGG